MATPHESMFSFINLLFAGSWCMQELNRLYGRDLGISLQEQSLLNQLGKGGGPVRLTDLSRTLMMSKAGVTRMMDRLEKALLVRRTPDPEDRRASNAELTAKGRRVLKRSREMLRAWVKENFTAHLDGAEIMTLSRILQRLLAGQGHREDLLRGLRGPRAADDR